MNGLLTEEQGDLLFYGWYLSLCYYYGITMRYILRRIQRIRMLDWWFPTRYKLSLRRSTTLFKLDDDDIIKHALAFKYFVDNIDFSKYQLSNMIAMDETSVFMGQGFQTTLIKMVPRQSIYPLLVMKVHVLLVFWQFIWVERKVHL